MESIKARAGQFARWLKSRQGKKVKYITFVVVVVLWCVYRFAVVAAQNRLVVYNPARAAVTDGVPVSVIDVRRTDGVLREPVTVRNNRAYVGTARARVLRPGQKIGDGVIVSVAQNIDLDTGMHAVRTRGVADGLGYALVPARGYFVPAYAVDRGVVMVAHDGAATARRVTVSAQDTDTAVISDGLSDGDPVIVTKVADGAKIQIKK